jgi:NitT/TauT family transport system substrate-binding protein
MKSLLSRLPWRALRLTALFAIALMTLAAPPVRADESNTIRVLATAIDLYSGAYYAQEEGFFKRAGLDVQITTLASGGAVGTALAGGSAEIGVSNVVNVATAFARGVPFTLIAGAGLYSTQASPTAVYVAKSSALRTAQDLEGKTVGVASLNDLATLALRKWITDHGGDPTKVRMIEMGYPEMIAGLSAGRIDAATLTEPFQTAARNGSARLFAKPFDAVAPEFNIGVWATTRSWAQAHPDLVKKFVAAIYAAAKWANTHQRESAQILANVAKADPKQMSEMTRAVQSTSLTAAHIQPALDIAYQFQLTNTRLNASDLIWDPGKP